MAENLHHAGANVSVIEMGNQVMAPVDFSIAAHVHQHLAQKGVTLYLEHAVDKFQKDGDLTFPRVQGVSIHIVLCQTVCE